MSVKVGLMLEAVRHQDKPFAWGVEKAAEIGYEYVEPMLHTGRELLSEAGYYHSVSQLEDPLWVREVIEKHGLKLSGFSTHAPLCKPEISLEWLKMSIRFAHYAGAPVVNTDEGPKPPWTSKEMDYTLMTYTLTEAAMVAERHGVKIGLEPHQQYSKTLEGLDSIYDLVWASGRSGTLYYGDVFHQNEVEQSRYNFELADTEALFRWFEDCERSCQTLIEAALPLPAYEQVLRASHTFNLLDARHAISVTERQRYILRIRTLARATAEAYLASREAMQFPLLNREAGAGG